MGMGTGWVLRTPGRARRIGRGLPAGSLTASARGGVCLQSPLALTRLPLASPNCRGEGSPRSPLSPSGCRLALRFLPLLPFFGMGWLEAEEVRPGPPPRRSGSVSRAPHAHPARGWRGCRGHRGVRGPGAEPRAVPEGLSRPRSPAPPARRPCVRTLLGLNRPAGVWKENRSPHPAAPLPTFRSRLFFHFNRDNQTFGSFFHS